MCMRKMTCKVYLSTVFVCVCMFVCVRLCVCVHIREIRIKNNRDATTSTRRLEQHPCEKQGPLRFRRQTNAQNSQSISTNAQDRSSQPPTTQAITTAGNDCHHTKMDSAAQRGSTADHPTIQLRGPLKSRVEETIETRSCTLSSNHQRQWNEPYIPQ